MKAIVYDAPRSFSYRDVAEPSLEDDDVLIHVKACGLCGTDLHIHEGEFNPRACRQLSQMVAAARWMPARKLRAVLS
jgi:D-arabinose 1-dehydrogenase-like Zn-dependent alcohol dehydrogenase